MDTILNNFRHAYTVLTRDVRVALRTQIGDSTRLSIQKQDVLQFLAAAEQHRNVFPPAEYATLTTSISSMLAALDTACHASTDPAQGSPLVVAQRIRTGRRGRPRVEIDPRFLSTALTLRGPSGLAPVAKCSSRTIRRRALEHGITQPGPPPYQDLDDPSGHVQRVWAPPTTQHTTLTDDQLDAEIAAILEVFPNFGRRMLTGYLKSLGYHVQRVRIAASYLRVHGLPRIFGDRRILRRKYHVPGANSLWHHDGQHGELQLYTDRPLQLHLLRLGLIRYKFITHAFVDGKSRLVTAIGVHTNNRSDTVLNLFLQAVAQYGAPSRIRGDHGTENVAVACWMEENRGRDRGSYIWGRSVHNTRIERLWYDVTRGYGTKWKNLFVELELYYGLDTNNPAHLWLLHFLFLVPINQDASEWAEAWNAHTISLDGERDRSPRDIFFFSLIEDGPRGLEWSSMPTEETLSVHELAEYGIDWEEQENSVMMQHLLTNNPQDWEDDNPFASVSQPAKLSHVECIPPDCPLQPDSLLLLQAFMQQQFPVRSRNVDICKTLWQQALAVCQQLHGGGAGQV